MCPAAFPGLERQPFAKGTGKLVSVPDKEFFKDRTLKKKKIKKEKGWVGGDIYECGKWKLYQEFCGEIRSWAGPSLHGADTLTAFESLRKELLTFLLKRKNQ